MKILKVVISDIRRIVEGTESDEIKFERILAAATPLSTVQSKIRSLSWTLLVHLAKELQFPSFSSSWDTEIANNMLTPLGRYKLATTKKPPTKKEISTWMLDIGNDVDDMENALEEAEKDVISGAEKIGKNYARNIQESMIAITHEDLLNFWKKFVKEYSTEFSYKRKWDAVEVHHLIEKSKLGIWY